MHGKRGAGQEVLSAYALKNIKTTFYANQYTWEGNLVNSSDFPVFSLRRSFGEARAGRWRCERDACPAGLKLTVPQDRRLFRKKQIIFRKRNSALLFLSWSAKADHPCFFCHSRTRLCGHRLRRESRTFIVSTSAILCIDFKIDKFEFIFKFSYDRNYENKGFYCWRYDR
jgi:hypothetical protein